VEAEVGAARVEGAAQHLDRSAAELPELRGGTVVEGHEIGLVDVRDDHQVPRVVGVGVEDHVGVLAAVDDE
jgi:hypothetical protein